jgi:hypothetical protein
VRKTVDLNILNNTPPWEWPRGAGDALMEVLRNPKSSLSDQITAASLAGETVVMNDEIAELLLSIVRSGGRPDDIRAQAAISLGPALEEADMDGFDDDISQPPISEETFHAIKKTLREIHNDPKTPKEVRRRALEAAVRATEDWHRDAIRAAYSSKDDDWILTAVFCMRFVKGFDAQILKMLQSANPELHYEAVCAAGNWELDAAWPHVAALAASPKTEKHLLLAAIEAVGSIRPGEAGEILDDLADSDDEDIADAASEALMMADAGLGEDDEDDEDEDEPL